MMRWTWVVLLPCLAVSASNVAAADNEPNTVTFAAKHRIPATLTLYETKGQPPGRLTPIYNNYRPKISFGSGDIICMFYLTPPVKTVAPGDTAAVSISCEKAISLNNGAGRFVVREGGKEVGFGIIHSPTPSNSP